MCVANVRPTCRQTPDSGSSFVIQKQLKSSADIFFNSQCVPLVNPQIQIKFLILAYDETLDISGPNKLRFVIQKRVKSRAGKKPTTFHCHCT